VCVCSRPNGRYTARGPTTRWRATPPSVSSAAARHRGVPDEVDLRPSLPVRRPDHGQRRRRLAHAVAGASVSQADREEVRRGRVAPDQRHRLGDRPRPDGPERGHQGGGRGAHPRRQAQPDRARLRRLDRVDLGRPHPRDDLDRELDLQGVRLRAARVPRRPQADRPHRLRSRRGHPPPPHQPDGLRHSARRHPLRDQRRARRPQEGAAPARAATATSPSSCRRRR
jgi:hypothetical protein